MLIVTMKRRKSLYIVLIAAVVSFIVALGLVLYLGHHSLAAQEKSNQDAIKKYDKQIADLKTKRLAEQQAKIAAEKAAKQKADADAALTAQQAGQVVTPAGCAVTGKHGDPNAIDVVINKKHCFNPIDFTPSDLVTVFGATISAKAQANFIAMYNAAAAAGVPITVTSSFRSYANQVATYNTWVKQNGSTAAADTVSARPGYSEHQTGLAMDLAAGSCSLECFRGTVQYTWMQNNAATYGFIERYQPGLEAITGYSPEAWHYRYVGPETAQSMKSKGVKTLEQLWNISGGSY